MINYEIGEIDTEGVSDNDPENGNRPDAIHTVQSTGTLFECQQPVGVSVQRAGSEQLVSFLRIWYKIDA